MKHFEKLLLFLFLAGSCYRLPLLPSEGGRRDGMDPHGGRETYREPAELSGDSLYISGVEYPPGYDWVRDTAHSSVSAEILLFKGAREILRIPAGKPWSADPDSHRISGGHLYTFAHGGGCTVIGRDGEEILRFESEESIRGFAVDEGRVLTLGQRPGGGFAFRVDGKPVFFADEGYIRGSLDRGVPRSGALYSNGGHWCFSYILDGEIHLVEDNREREIPPLDNMKDVLLLGGNLFAMCLQKESLNYLVYAGLGTRLMNYMPGIRNPEALCGLVADDGEVRMLLRDGGLTYVWDIRTPGVKEVSTRPLELYPVRGGADAVVYLSGGRVVETVPGKLPEGSYSLVSGACAMVSGGSFLLGLSGLEGSPNMIVRGGEAAPLAFNGPITSIAIG